MAIGSVDLARISETTVFSVIMKVNPVLSVNTKVKLNHLLKNNNIIGLIKSNKYDLKWLKPLLHKTVFILDNLFFQYPQWRPNDWHKPRNSKSEQVSSLLLCYSVKLLTLHMKYKLYPYIIFLIFPAFFPRERHKR